MCFHLQEEVLTVFGLVALSPEEVCAGYLKQCGSEYDPFSQHWNISVPGSKPSVETVPTPKVRDNSFGSDLKL